MTPPCNTRAACIIYNRRRTCNRACTAWTRFKSLRPYLAADIALSERASERLVALSSSMNLVGCSSRDNNAATASRFHAGDNFFFKKRVTRRHGYRHFPIRAYCRWRCRVIEKKIIFRCTYIYIWIEFFFFISLYSTRYFQ